MIKIGMIRFKASTIILISVIGLCWILCSRFFNSDSSEALFSEQKYHEVLSRIYYDLGKLSQSRGDLKKSTHFLKNALKADSSFLKPYEMLEEIYSLRNKKDKAELMHQKVIALHSKK